MRAPTIMTTVVAANRFSIEVQKPGLITEIAIEGISVRFA